MLLFADTEFTDFINCDMISLGIVSEDGKHEFYVEISDYEYSWRSSFVNEVVLPLLEPQKYAKNYRVAAWELKRWIEELPTDKVTFVVDYGTDWTLLSEMLNTDRPNKEIEARMYETALIHALHTRGMHTLEQHHAAWGMMVLGTEDYYEEIDSRRHHALVDAKSNRHGWQKAFDVV